jgi:ribosome-associated translation inhibitor RaiA
MSKDRVETSIFSNVQFVRCAENNERMKVQIRPRGVPLTTTQRVRLEHDLEMVLARFGERIDRVIVKLAAGEGGFTSCELEVRLKPQVVKAQHSDTDVFLAVDYAAKRAARSVSRAIEREGVVPH